MSLTEQIEWLGQFNKDWDALADIENETERAKADTKLIDNYDKFLKLENLPKLSADELLCQLQTEQENADN